MDGRIATRDKKYRAGTPAQTRSAVVTAAESRAIKARTIRAGRCKNPPAALERTVFQSSYTPKSARTVSLSRAFVGGDTRPSRSVRPPVVCACPWPAINGNNNDRSRFLRATPGCEGRGTHRENCRRVSPLPPPTPRTIPSDSSRTTYSGVPRVYPRAGPAPYRETRREKKKNNCLHTETKKTNRDNCSVRGAA